MNTIIPAEILIVDDMLPNLRLLAGMLSNHGYLVREAMNGVEALECINEHSPDLVLMDIRMPGMDGYSVCQQIKANQATRNIPVIFVSALDEQTDKIQGFAVGGIDYITKPFHIREVLARVDTQITVRRLQRQSEEHNTQLQQQIDERLRAEQALQAANEELERRVTERTVELAQANQSLNAELRERGRAEAERERLLEQVHQQAQQVREIMNTVPEGLLLLDSGYCIAQANPAAQNYLKLLAEGVQTGDRLTRLADQPIQRVLTSPPRGLFHEIGADGHTFEVITRPVADEADSQRWVMLIRDVTREREFQRRLQQQERLAAVGQMSAGIAHDFNNILAVILLYSEMALATPDIPQRLRERLQIITQQSRRASELIEQILDFSRRSIIERHTMDLLPFLKEQIKLLERTLPETIHIQIDVSPGEYSVEGDPTRMQQMLMNLAVNARDAMPGGGKLTIGLSPQPRSKPIQCVSCGSVMGSEWIHLQVQDTGMGIDQKDLPYIFEPFFTTKEPGKGTGLGLAQVYGIVKSHEGHIHIESSPENGTIFHIYLPAPAHQQTRSADTDPFHLIRGAGQTILLVEDEAATRQALVEGLTLINYRVLPAANGKAALECMGQESAPVDLVLSDVVMPEMGGIALLRAIRKTGSQVPIIFMTGHAIPTESPLDRDERPLIWLQKPPRLKQLSQIISRALS